MSVLFPWVIAIPGYVVPVLRTVTCRVTRDGEQTSGVKVVRIFKDPSNPTAIAVFFLKTGGDVSQYFQASVVDGEWVAVAIDNAAPKLGAVKFVAINQDLVISFDLSEGGGSNPGSPGTVAALVKVSGQPASRRLVAVELATDGFWRLVGEGASEAQGSAELDVKVTQSSQVFVMAVDNWGFPFQGSLAVAVDDVVRPAVFTGWLYRITEAGTLPAAEPEWWPAEGDNASRLLGTARAIAVRYYQPLAHGPLPVELL